MRQRLLALAVSMAFLAPLWAQAPGLPERLKTYTPEEVHRLTLADFFRFLQAPQPGYQANAAALALQTRAEASPRDRESIEKTALEIARRPDLGAGARSRAFYLLRDLKCENAVPVLGEVLAGNEAVMVRSAAACALGGFRTTEAQQLLEQTARREKDETVLDWIRRSLARQSQPVPEALQKVVRLWLVKDWVRLRNTGPATVLVEFARFFPPVDEEQLVLGRWVEAHTDDGTDVPVALRRVEADADLNLVHTYRLQKLEANQEVTVVITALVARRARPPLQPPQPLPDTVDGYPEGVRNYLASTPMVPVTDPLVRQYALGLLARGREGYALANSIADLLRAVKPVAGETPAKHPGMGLPEFVLRYGGTPGQSAVAGAALCRACGLPAQLTYYPGGSALPVVDVYFSGYGWSRLMPQAGMAVLPEQGYAMPRVYNLPFAAEQDPGAYLAPYNSWDKSFVIRAGGQPCSAIRTWNAVEDKRLKQIMQPFPHYECGMACRQLGEEPYAAPWLAWDELADVSLQAAQSLAIGPFSDLQTRLPGLAGYAEKATSYREEAPPPKAAGG